MSSPILINPALAHCGWRTGLVGIEDLGSTPARLVRVVAQHRSGYRVTDGAQEFPVQSPAPWTRRGISPEQRAAVGDWVLLAADANNIERLLPRFSLLRRGAAGEHYARQLIAANIDTVLIVCGLDGDFNLRRIERYLLVVQGSGATPVIVLTKADRSDDTEGAVASVRALAGAAAVLGINAKDPASVQALAPWLQPGQSLVLVGSSGAGKSTLTNTLLGQSAQRTAAVRAEDSRGRHTTTHRSLLNLPGGACLIDTPGMRELKLTGDEVLSQGGFEDVDALATGCRFRDCSHLAEPGCAVQAALAEGRLDAARLANYRKLQSELALAGNQQALQARKSNERLLGRALNKRLTEKYGRR